MFAVPVGAVRLAGSAALAALAEETGAREAESAEEEASGIAAGEAGAPAVETSGAAGIPRPGIGVADAEVADGDSVDAAGAEAAGAVSAAVAVGAPAASAARSGLPGAADADVVAVVVDG
ncbi:hypothetical protein GCM10022219_04050 [Microbacterium oryzae]